MDKDEEFCGQFDDRGGGDQNPSESENENVREATSPQEEEDEEEDPQQLPVRDKSTPPAGGGNNPPPKNKEDEKGNASSSCSKTTTPAETNGGGELGGRRRKVVCDECGVEVTHIRNHKQAVHNPNLKMFKCPRCPLEFRRSGTLWAHVNSKHATATAAAAEEGWEEMEQDNDRIHHPDDKNPSSKKSGGGGGGDCESLCCSLCGQLFATAKTLKKHQDFVHGGGGVCCPVCGQLFSSLATLQRHEYFAHGEGTKPENKLLCPHCPKSFKQKATLDDHIRRTHEGKGFHCDLCPGGRRGDLQSAAKLWKHKVDYHGLTDLEPPEGLQLLQCRICGERMFRHLEAHIKKAHPGVDIGQIQAIKEPTKSTTTGPKKTKVKQEVNYKLPRSNAVKPSECPHCLKTFANSSSIGRHLRMVHGIGKLSIFQCPQPHCERVFRARFILDNHIRGHERDRINEALPSVDFLELVKLTQRGGSDGKAPVSAFCLLCDSSMDNLADTRTHLAVEHPQLYQSLKKGESSSPSATSTSAATTPTLIQCKADPACPAKLAIGELRLHLESAHDDALRPGPGGLGRRKCWRCPVCSKVMLSPAELSFHFKVRHRKVSWRNRSSRQRRPRGKGRGEEKVERPKNNNNNSNADNQEENITIDEKMKPKARRGRGAKATGRVIGAGRKPTRSTGGNKKGEVVSVSNHLRRSPRKRRRVPKKLYETSSSSSSNSDGDDDDGVMGPSSKNEKDESAPIPPAFAVVKQEEIELKELRIRLVRLTQQEILMHTKFKL